VVGCCEPGDERSGGINGREFFDRLSGYQLVKRVSVPQLISG
jgi:hypothetical protein